MIAPLDNLAAMQHKNLIRIANRRQPVRDDERRPPFADNLQRLLDQPFRLAVDAGCRLIQDQNRRIERQRSAKEISCR